MILSLSLASPAFAFSTINEMGTGTVPVLVQACSGGSTQVITGSPTSTSYELLPEAADVRCNVGTSGNAAPAIAPTATAGHLLKANVSYTEFVLSTLRLDCCGVAGAVSVDTWHE